ncbi:MAG TPA: ABC transporter permease [Acidimicrobiales bacterium]|nr:ABC transporter permease [Acidimicrobiales bacterium]
MTASSSLRRSPVLLVGMSILATFAVVGVLGPWIAPYDPHVVSGKAFESPSGRHLLGTNAIGADNLSRLVIGARTTLAVAVGSTSLILVIGMAVGLAAAVRGGLVDVALMRLVDVFLAVPTVPLLMVVAVLAGPSLPVSILMIGVIGWPQTARIIRSQTLSLRRRGFMQIARGFGARPTYLMRRHIVPTLGPVVGANLVYVAGTAVTIEAGLAFLGLGDPIAVSWGADLSRSAATLSVLVPTGLALTLLLLGFTLVGVGLEPRFNPR